MKKIISLLLGFLIGSLLTSCFIDERRELSCEFPGGIIIDKTDLRISFGDVFYTVKHNGELHKVEAFQIDFNYVPGDTIKAPCLQPN